jgi:glycosyltransferase involved in cell wall biosynthesis
MTNPTIFSIILPTRNRSHVIGEAIDSVLAQSLESWELIIVDNDVSEATFKVVKNYTDTRIKYYRTGSLAMHDNWEFGIKQTEGEYITVLEDKARLSSNALEIIYNGIKEYNVDIVSWPYNGLSAFQFGQEDEGYHSNNQTIYSSEEILQMFRSHLLEHCQHVIPRFINSCCHRSIIAKASSTPIGRVFNPVAPDFTSAFLQLFLYDSVLYIDSMLSLGDFRFSNGGDFLRKNVQATDYRDFLDLTLDGNESKFYHNSPIKSINTLINYITADYTKMQSILGGRLSYYPLDRISFYINNFDVIRQGEQMGADYSFERIQVEESLAQECGNTKRAVVDNEKIIKEHRTYNSFKFLNIIFEEIIKEHAGSKKIVFWGANNILLALLNHFNRIDKADLIVVDNDPQKTGKVMGEKEIAINSPSSIKKEETGIIIITAIAYSKEIKAQIHHLFGDSIKVLSIDN